MTNAKLQTESPEPAQWYASPPPLTPIVLAELVIVAAVSLGLRFGTMTALYVVVIAS